MGLLPGQKMEPPPKHVPAPMVPSGTVVPPEKVKKRNRKAERDANEKFVFHVSKFDENMICGFVVDPDSGDVKLSYRLNEFPSDRFEQAAEAFADMLVKLLREHPHAGRILERVAQSVGVKPPAESPPAESPAGAAQSSEATPAESPDELAVTRRDTDS